ncbi:beta/gamma crystallin domain-containing protein [Streptomyces sp. NPDC005794]|uniref:beta/gamma crystallin domain-containing protein n=1 Tax=Streptomyces sp. NPDC005794 TaxID=3364733 RepID=UPI003688C8AC
MTHMRKIASSSAAAIAAAVALTVAVPAGNAYAIDRVTCRDGAGYLKVEGHDEFGISFTDCFANRGTWEFGSVWLSRITTGNNDVVFYDINGSTVSIKRNTVYKPSNAAHVSGIKIL